MGLIVLLYRAYGVLARLFIILAAIGIAAMFLLMMLGSFVESRGSKGLQQLIHSDGFFPWPVATLFYLGQWAPWLIAIGALGAVIWAMLRRAIFSASDRVLAVVVSVRQTGVTVNGLPQMRLGVQIAGREIMLKALIDLGNMPRAGDTVWVEVSRADPDAIRYAGLARL